MENDEVQVIVALIQAVREETKTTVSAVKEDVLETKKHVAALEKEYELVAAQQAELLRTFKTIKSLIKWFGSAVTILVGIFQLLMFLHIGV